MPSSGAEITAFAFRDLKVFSDAKKPSAALLSFIGHMLAKNS